MTVEANELGWHLNDYLRKIRATGEAITVCEAAEPVATLAPIQDPFPLASNGGLLDALLAAPVPARDFQPLTREEIYDRR